MEKMLLEIEKTKYKRTNLREELSFHEINTEK